MWKHDNITINNLSIPSQAIHNSIMVSSPPSRWLVSIIYASTDFNLRRLLWDQLMYITDTLDAISSNRWLVGGDFPEILRGNDKFGGNRINFNRSSMFWDCINHCKRINLGFRGSKNTWSNIRYRNRQGLILEKLDRRLVNDH